MFDILIRGARVIDPHQGLDAVKDLAISGQRIAAILEPSADTSAARRIVYAAGKIAVPGLIDFHVHVFEGVSHFGIDPDSTCLSRGVTTVLDFGTAGGMIFPGLRRYVVNHSKTRVTALLNIAAQGLIDSLGNPPAYGELHDLRHCDVDLAEQVVNENRDLIFGIKIRCTDNLAEGGCNEGPALQRARQAADRVGLPLVVHSPNSTLPIEAVLDQLGPGDVLTHCYHGKRCGLVDAQRQPIAGIKRKLADGLLLDVGHGFSSFDFRVARNLIGEGILPSFISSDIHAYNVHGPVFDLTTTMDKFLHLGMSLPDVIRCTTELPARFLRMEDKIGSLKPGACADMTILELQTGEFPLTDCEGNSEISHQRIEPTHVFRAGTEFGIVARPTEVRNPHSKF